MLQGDRVSIVIPFRIFILKGSGKSEGCHNIGGSGEQRLQYSSDSMDVLVVNAQHNNDVNIRLNLQKGSAILLEKSLATKGGVGVGREGVCLLTLGAQMFKKNLVVTRLI